LLITIVVPENNLKRSGKDCFTLFFGYS